MHHGPVISVELARALRDAGLQWTPASGDRFVIADRDMDDDVFTLSEMTVQVHSDSMIGFNGSDEWALDSVDFPQALWLPGEGQLRERLGATFRRLERRDEGWTVTIEVLERRSTVAHDDPAEAYGLALLALINLAT